MRRNEIDAVRALLSAKPRPVGWAERRQRLDEVGSVWPVASDVKLEAIDLGGVPGEWSMVPGSDASRVLLFFHGGGYCSGSIVSHRRMVTEAGRAAGVRTLAIGYRLAPEHPFPAAFDDALTAWRFLRKHEIAAGRIAVGGDSAGGGLTVALLTYLRDAREAFPGCAWLISPWTDLTMSGATLLTKDAVDPLIHKPLSRGIGRSLSSRRNGSTRPARLSPLCRLARPATNADPGRIGRDAVRRRCALCDRGRRGQRRDDARDLARHDPCLAIMERAPGRRPARARQRGRVHAPASLKKREVSELSKLLRMA